MKLFFQPCSSKSSRPLLLNVSCEGLLPWKRHLLDLEPRRSCLTLTCVFSLPWQPCILLTKPKHLSLLHLSIDHSGRSLPVDALIIPTAIPSNSSLACLSMLIKYSSTDIYEEPKYEWNRVTFFSVRPWMAFLGNTYVISLKWRFYVHDRKIVFFYSNDSKEFILGTLWQHAKFIFKGGGQRKSLARSNASNWTSKAFFLRPPKRKGLAWPFPKVYKVVWDGEAFRREPQGLSRVNTRPLKINFLLDQINTIFSGPANCLVRKKYEREFI